MELNNVDLSKEVLDHIQEDIRSWREITNLYVESKLNVSAIADLYSNRNCFEITENQISKWAICLKGVPKDDQKIHMYVGVKDEAIKFYLIDSKSDLDKNFVNRILSKDFKHKEISSQLTGVIDYHKAVERIKAWENHKETWLRQIKQREIFKIIEINFNDYLELQLKKGETCQNYLALKGYKKEPNQFDIEVIVVNGNNKKKIATDYSSPRPPFGQGFIGTNYQLLQLSYGPINN